MSAKKTFDKSQNSSHCQSARIHPCHSLLGAFPVRSIFCTPNACALKLPPGEAPLSSSGRINLTHLGNCSQEVALEPSTMKTQGRIGENFIPKDHHDQLHASDRSNRFNVERKPLKLASMARISPLLAGIVF